MDNKYNILVSFCAKYNAKLIKYEYYKKIFGNFLIEIKYKDKVYKLVTDKSEIYLDSNLLSDSSYHIAGQDDTFTRLLEVIEKEVFKEK